MKKILILLLILLMSTGCQKEIDNKPNKDIVKPQKSIKEIDINYNNIIALTHDNEIYVIGDAGYGLGLGEGIDNVVEPTKVADNVKQMKSGVDLCYIDNNNDLYYTGISLQGGVDESFVKLGSNITKIETCSYYCVIISDDNNTTYAFTGTFNKDWVCGLEPGKYDEKFTELATDVKQAYGTFNYNSYINLNNELFIIEEKNPIYTKIADNVEKIVGNWILTEDNILYSYDFYKKNLIKISDNVEDIDSYSFKAKDGYFYFNDYSNDLLVASDVEDYFRLKFDNVEKILYKDTGKYIYLNTDNKIEMYTEYDHYVLDNDISSMVKMLEFVSD